MFCSITAFGQQITGLLTNIDGEPLIGANVVWENTDIGTITDVNGNFSLSDDGIEHRVLLFSFIGFRTEKIKVGTLKHWEIMLIEDNTIKGVEINAKSSATRYANTPAKIEVIGTREIERAACCSLAGCFSTNSNVVAATTNIITDAKELQILGLAGVYNQLLFDDFPLIQGLGYQYGTGSFPGTTIKNIFVAKGSNSVLQGAQSISGQINIIPHAANDTEKLYLNAFANSFGGTQYNVNFATNKTNWNNLLTAHLTTPAAIRDKDGDGFRDIVQTNRMSFYNKLTYQNPKNDKFKGQFGVRFWKETREGGQVEFEADKHLGTQEYYGQHVDLNHIDLYAKFNYKINDDLSLTFQNSNFKNIQDNYYGVKRYEGEQLNISSNLFMDYFYGATDNNMKFGFSFIKNDIDETITEVEDLSFIDFAGDYNVSYVLPGAFVEHSLNLNKITLITGVRADKYEDIGLKFVPRLLLRYEISESSDFRFSIGKGLRIAHIFSERIN
jgi:outer membrane receptor for ferrienterochelin and colicin